MNNILTGLIGALLSLFGFALYMGGIQLIGLFLGGSLGGLVGAIIANVAELAGGLSLLIVLGAVLLGALLGWFLINAAHRLLVVLIGIGVGFYWGRTFLADLGGIWAEPWMPFVAAILGAILFVFLWRYAVILVTTLVGASLLYQATGLGWVWLVTLIVGLIVQISAFTRLGLRRRVEYS